MHSPGSELDLIGSKSFKKYLYRDVVFRDKFRREHEYFVDVLRGEGVEVILLGDILRDDEKARSLMGRYPNLVYTRDIVSVTRAGSIVMRMKSKVRAKEAEIAKLALEKLGVPKLMEVSSPGTMEGGDLVYMSDETLLVGIGDRTNNTALKQLLGHLRENGLETVIAVPLPQWAVHLDGLLMFLDRDLCIIHKQSLTGISTLVESSGKKRRIDLIDYLASKGFKLIEVTDYGRHMRATNLVAIGSRKAVGYAGIDRVKSLLIQNGVDLIEIEGSELIRGGGGPHCMTAPILRD
jgi:arginine deiminase